MNTVTAAVHDALTASLDMVAASSKVKRLLCAELERAAPSADIHSTAYFNHTYVPDLVLNWPGGDPREVFLRFVSSPERLIADIDVVGSSGPVIIDLSPAAPRTLTRDAAGLARQAAQQATDRAPQLLITDSEATTHIRPRDAQNVVERLVAGNLLRHGRGHLDESTTTRTVEAARAGYDGAVETDAEKVNAALAAARQRFNPETEQRVKRTLQLLWMMGGGSFGEFPADALGDEVINSADTRDFLQEVFADEPIIEDDKLWERLAEHLDFDTLVGVEEVPVSENLNRLMRILAGRLLLSHATLDLHERQLPLSGRLSWRLADRFLDLQGPEWVCRFTPHGARFSQRRDVGKPIALSEAALRSAPYQVSAAQIDEATRQIRLNSKVVEQDQPTGDTLRALTDGFGDTAAVRTLTVSSENSLITADFERMMVGADPDATVRTMAHIATTILAALDDHESVELTKFLGS